MVRNLNASTFTERDVCGVTELFDCRLPHTCCGISLSDQDFSDLMYPGFIFRERSRKSFAVYLR